MTVIVVIIVIVILKVIAILIVIVIVEPEPLTVRVSFAKAGLKAAELPEGMIVMCRNRLPLFQGPALFPSLLVEVVHVRLRILYFVSVSLNIILDLVSLGSSTPDNHRTGAGR